MRKLIRITDTESLRAEGIHFPSVGATRWFAAQATNNKFREAVVRIGRRVFIDPDRYHEIARGESARSAPSEAIPRENQDSPMAKAASLAARCHMRLWREGQNGSIKAAQVGKLQKVLLEFPDWPDAAEYFEYVAKPSRRAPKQQAVEA